MNKPACILVLDDDPDIAVMLKMMLEYKGFQVIIATRAEQANDFFLSHNIQLIIMDMLLSGTNGIDVCHALKQDKVTGKIPVMMISAHPNAKEICLEAGANDFISKPFDMQDMLGKINRLIQQMSKKKE